MLKSVGYRRFRLFGGRRWISQHIEVSSQNAASPVAFSFDLTKTPWSFGYFSSRVNRAYNEDRFQADVLDMNLLQRNVISGGSIENNAPLQKRINKPVGPVYTQDSNQHNKIFNYNIFDGHGGSECCDYVKAHLAENVEQLIINEGTIQYLSDFYKKKIGGYWKRWTRRENQQILKEMGLENAIVDRQTGGMLIKSPRLQDRHNKVWNLPEFQEQVTPFDFIRFRLFWSFLYTDYQFLTWEIQANRRIDEKHSGHLISSGSTCTSCYIYGLDRAADTKSEGFYFQDRVLSRLLVAQVGDTRAILCDKNGVAHALTRDHHPSNPTESRRLTKFSANLIMTDSFGEERYLNLANTRSFGDISAKDVGVSAEPEFFDYLIGDPELLAHYKQEHSEHLEKTGVRDFGGDECFIVLVSDGITNYMTDQEVVDIVTSCGGIPQDAAKQVVNFVEMVGGDDNATCCIVRLSGWGKWPANDRTKKLRQDRLNTTLHRT